MTDKARLVFSLVCAWSVLLSWVMVMKGLGDDKLMGILMTFLGVSFSYLAHEAFEAYKTGVRNSKKK